MRAQFIKKQGALKLPVKPHGKHRDDCKSSSLFFVSIHNLDGLTVQRYTISRVSRKKRPHFNISLTYPRFRQVTGEHHANITNNHDRNQTHKRPQRRQSRRRKTEGRQNYSLIRAHHARSQRKAPEREKQVRIHQQTHYRTMIHLDFLGSPMKNRKR